MSRFSRFLIHPFSLAVSPILALLTANIAEVNAGVALRPLLVSLAGMLVVLGLLRWVTRSWLRAAVVTSFWLVMFYSYGQIYQLLKQYPVAGLNLGRHRYLAIIFAVVFLLVTWFLIKRLQELKSATLLLNIAGLALVIMPLLQITSYYLRSYNANRVTVQAAAVDSLLQVEPGQPLPDVYYLVLDTYTRADALQRDFGYDNSVFINELEQMGFYVADCSRSNYSYTQASMTATLNLDYLPALFQSIRYKGLSDSDIWVLLKQSLVRQQLSNLGYKTVSFATGYDWSELSDADIFFSLARGTNQMQLLKPFETLLIKSTALLFLTDSNVRLVSSRFNMVNFPFGGHINNTRFILDQLQRLPSVPGPKFVFVHLLVPHVPYVFGPDGEVLTDPGYYSGEKAAPIDQDYLVKGYTGQVTFINQRMLEIFKTILSESKTPPVIVLMGDHGLGEGNRLQILNAYYLPGGDYAAFYATITPVNSFRLIFNQLYGTSFPLLPDQSFMQDQIDKPVAETAPQCLTP